MPLWKIVFVIRCGGSEASMTEGLCGSFFTKKAPTKCRGQLAERIVRYVLRNFCHVGCLRTLLSLNDLELHTIAFGEGFKTAA